MVLLGSGSEMALDEQLVPCQDDETHFPPQSTFMAQTPIQVNQIYVQNRLEFRR